MTVAATLPKHLFNPKRHSFFLQVLQCVGVCCSYPKVVCFQWEKFYAPFLAGFGSWVRLGAINCSRQKKRLSLTNVKISVASRDDEKINVRVDLPGKETQKAFDDALTSLARDAPPVPGFRRSKGGKSSNIPNSILLQMLGKSRVTKFVLQEILSITIGDFVRKENLKVNPEIKTTQSEEELESAFTPGSAFGFNVILQLEKSDSDEVSDGSS